MPAVQIRVNNKVLPQKIVQKYIFALNKPKGYLCANRTTNTEGSPRLVIDLFKASMKGSLLLGSTACAGTFEDVSFMIFASRGPGLDCEPVETG